MQPDIRILNDALTIPELNRKRTLRIYLPPGYECSDTRYPVLYMHDAQNLFDPDTSYSGDWGVGHHLNAMADSHDLNVIVVGIDNGGEHRIDELSPWHNSEWGGGDGALYASFLVNEVKPYIDREFRTLADRDNTLIGGSSLGGLISHFSVYEYPDIFGKALIFSPSYWFNSDVYEFTRTRFQQLRDRAHADLYLLAGGRESFITAEPVQSMYEQLLDWGHPEDRIRVKHVEHGEHSEWFWNAEFREAVRWMFALH